MVTHLKALFGKGKERGFTLIELLIVILIVGILAAVATPLYLGYVRDARTAEGKAVAGALWSAVQADSIATCGVAAAVSNSFPKAGLTAAGATTPARWTATGGNTLTVTCATGAYAVSSPTLFTITGVAAATDVNFITVQLVYNAGAFPPSQLQCATNGIAAPAFVPC